MSESQTGEAGSSFARRMSEDARLLGNGFTKMLSPPSLLAGLKTMLWLGPLTLLIWIYAEQGQKKDAPGEGIPIAVRSVDPRNVYVELRMKNDESAITADLSGPAGQLDELRRKFQSNDVAQPVEVTIPSSLEPGVNNIPVAPLLRANPIFATSSVQIGKCNPETITVFVDAIEEKDLEVKKPDALKNIDVALFDPPIVHVRAPADAFKRSIKLEAQLNEAANVGKSGEQHAAVHVKLADIPLNEARAIVYDTEIVKATYTVKENADDEFTYRSIPILTLGPSALLSKYDVVYDEDKDTLANVTVIGPADKIAALKRTADTRPEELPKPRAVLEVKGDDRLFAGQSFRSRQLKFDQLPDASIRISPKSERSEVRFQIVDRTANQ